MIPLTRPWLEANESNAVARVLQSGMLVQGPHVQAFEAAVATACARTHAIATSSGTAALQLALRALGIGAGNEVVVPALTWPSPAHAVLAVGATPVLVDVDPHEWNVSAETLAQARSARTGAAIVICQFGNPARTREIIDALSDLPIVEDAACALGSRYLDAPCGSWGDISCLSFHPRKIITTGEGGICLTDRADLEDKLRAMRNHGQSAPGRFELASGNYRLTEVQGAIGLEQMNRLQTIVSKRRALAQQILSALPELTFQRTPKGALSNYQTLGALLPAGTGRAGRDRFVQQLRARGVQCGALSYALHELGHLRGQARVPGSDGDLPFASDIAARGVALPLYPQMTEDEVQEVIASVRAVLRELP